LFHEKAQRRNQSHPSQSTPVPCLGIVEEQPVSNDGDELGQSIIVQVVSEWVGDGIGRDQEEEGQRDGSP
jgi:hypothetical protein